MSQQELPQGDAPVEAPKKSKKKLIIIVLILLLLIGGGAGGAWFMLQDPDSFVSQMLNGGGEDGAEPVEEESAGESPNVDSNAPTKLAATYLTSLPPLTINLADSNTIRYLRIGIDLEATSEQAIGDIKSNSAKIRDSIIILLSSKKYSDIETADGKFKLKHEISSRINQILGAPRIVQIYFTDFVVQ